MHRHIYWWRKRKGFLDFSVSNKYIVTGLEMRPYVHTTLLLTSRAPNFFPFALEAHEIFLSDKHIY
jgi:hypothetical protein